MSTNFPAREEFSTAVLQFYPKWRSLYEAMEAESHAHCYTDEEIAEYNTRHHDPFLNHLIILFHHADLFPDPVAFPPSSPLGECLASEDPMKAVNDMVNTLSWLTQRTYAGDLDFSDTQLKKMGEQLEAFEVFLD